MRCAVPDCCGGRVGRISNYRKFPIFGQRHYRDVCGACRSDPAVHGVRQRPGIHFGPHDTEITASSPLMRWRCAVPSRIVAAVGWAEFQIIGNFQFSVRATTEASVEPAAVSGRCTVCDSAAASTFNPMTQKSRPYHRQCARDALCPPPLMRRSGGQNFRLSEISKLRSEPLPRRLWSLPQLMGGARCATALRHPLPTL
jgi:hypothetical protein